MKTSTGASRSLIVIGTSLWAGPAAAQLWDPLDTVPKPNAIIGQDTSVTMGIEADCSACHAPGDSRTRLDLSKGDLLQSLPLFKDYFVFGAFEYSGCDYAKINGGSRIMPTPTNPTSSYNAVFNQISNAVHCRSRENRLPAGGSSSGCATPTPNCSGDLAIIQGLMQGQLQGFNPIVPWLDFPCRAPGLSSWCGNCQGDQSEGNPCYYVGPQGGPLTPGTWADVQTGIANDPALVNISTCQQGFCENPIVTCDGGGSYQVQAALLSKLQRMNWPRWYDGNITGADVQRDLCDPIAQIYTEVANEMRACSSSRYVLPPDLSSGNWCIPGQIRNSACSPGSPFYGTCVCDNTDPMCQSSVRVNSDCGNPLTWKARQQVAVCETYDRSAPDRFGSFFRSQSDNVVNAGGCRENVAMFFTDGYMGGTAGTAMEAATALPTYSSYGGRSNMFVFRVANVFTGDADAMMSSVTRGQIANSYLATDLVNMQVSFARILNRVYKGVYTGASMGLDNFGSRAAFHAFTVPGYTLGAPIGDDYLGWPARIAWHAVDATGNVNPNPLFETDWQSKVTGASSCGASYTIGGGLPNPVPEIGPGGTFRNGVARTAVIPANLFDRNGDGVADRHPALQFGNMFSIASTKPLVLEAPRSAPEGPTGVDLLNFMARVRTRPRMIYVMSNGWLHGFEAGVYRNAVSTFGNQKVAFTYDDTVASAGTEVFRFAPNWVDDPTPGNTYDYAMNNLVQQPMITGQLFASDVNIRVGGRDDFHTVLVGAQGKSGRGVFAIDVSDPCRSTLLSQWTLPNAADKASNEPAVYTVAMTVAPKMRPAVIMTGGAGGTSNIYAHDVATGLMLYSAALPGGNYPTAPVCADVTGDGHVTHCYVVADDGRLIRVEVRFDGRFGRVDDITPAGVGGGGLKFSTSPAVYFGPDGAPNIVYASGDYQNLTTAGGQNYVYKVIDSAARRSGIPGTRGNIAQACGSGGTRTSGIIPLQPGERVISPPVVAKGLVMWAGYTPQSSGCVAGTGNAYAMKYDSCADATGGGATPVAHPTGDGIPSSPALLRGAQKIIVSTSAKPTGAQVVNISATTRGGNIPVVKRLYWRPESDVR